TFAANSRSKRFVFGPVVSQPERIVSTTSSISASVICGSANGRNVARLARTPTPAFIFAIRLSSMTEQHLNYRFQKNEYINRDRLVLDVVQIILQFDERLVTGTGIGIFDLRPTGQARFDA